MSELCFCQFVVEFCSLVAIRCSSKETPVSTLMKPLQLKVLGINSFGTKADFSVHFRTDFLLTNLNHCISWLFISFSRRVYISLTIQNIFIFPLLSVTVDTSTCSVNSTLSHFFMHMMSVFTPPADLFLGFIQIYFPSPLSALLHQAARQPVRGGALHTPGRVDQPQPEVSAVP